MQFWESARGKRRKKKNSWESGTLIMEFCYEGYKDIKEFVTLWLCKRLKYIRVKEEEKVGTLHWCVFLGVWDIHYSIHIQEQTLKHALAYNLTKSKISTTNKTALPGKPFIGKW